MNHPYPALDPDTDCSLGALRNLIGTNADGQAVGAYGEFTLGSHFQPILSVAHARPVGYEALMRPVDGSGRAIPPTHLLALQETFAEKLLLDRLSRVVHVDNFLRLGATNQWLFVNVQPEVFIRSLHHGRFFPDLFASRAITPGQIVIEVLEQAVADDSRWTEAVAGFRALGCLIALDDFGAGHSNFDRVWTIRPDIVKIDRQLVARGAREPALRRAVPEIVSLLHEAGALVVMEGIETEDEAMLAMDSDTDFVQGWYFGRPGLKAADAPAARRQIEDLWQRFRASVAPQIDRHRRSIAPYQNAIGHACSLMEAGMPVLPACAGFLDLPDALRCYLLDEDGMQEAPNMEAPGLRAVIDPRYAPLGEAKGASWARRPYFRRALEYPGKVQVSRPYLSLADARPCVTLSMHVRTAQGVRVLCGDIAWTDPATR